MTEAERRKAAEAEFVAIKKEATQGTGFDAEVKAYFDGNEYYLCVYETYRDVRLVGTPPESVGKFGGDTDNWMWPRHTGDFSMFRVYAGKDGKPAAYSKDNVPLKPKHFLPVSTSGVKEGDFTMIFGFPGRTNRFLSSYGVKMALDISNPAVVAIRDKKLKLMKENMDANPAVRIKYAAKYAQIANYWKYYIGQTEQLKRLNIRAEKQKKEMEFTKWVSSKPEYMNLMAQYEQAYKAYEPYAVQHVYAGGNGLLASVWVRNANTLAAALDTRVTKKDDQAFLSTLNEDLGKMLRNYENTYSENADKKIFAQILAAFYVDVPKSQHPAFMTKIVQDNWAGSPEDSFKKYADYLWNKSVLIKPASARDFWANPSKDVLESDPGYLFAKNLVPSTYAKANFGTVMSDLEGTKTKLDNLYLKALLDKNKDMLMYPDANSTMRISYGQVQSYSPKDAITYNTTTTIDGMMAKYEPGNGEFDLPQSLLKAYEKHDFGRYAENGTLPVAFISNNDITGGNSGSPVINADGELIGLAFDGNWEAMSGDIAFDKKYKRTISVDTRFVLWCIDVLGGAKNIIDELDVRM
jgi:hypothetical protein